MSRIVFGRSPYTLLVLMWTNAASGACPAGGFEQVQGADGVHVEVVERAGRGEVVARLGGGVDDQVGPAVGDQREHPGPVADVEFDVGERRVGVDEPLLVPAGVAAGAEEVGPLVVVDPDHPPPGGGRSGRRPRTRSGPREPVTRRVGIRLSPVGRGRQNRRKCRQSRVSSAVFWSRATFPNP